MVPGRAGPPHGLLLPRRAVLPEVAQALRHGHAARADALHLAHRGHAPTPIAAGEKWGRGVEAVPQRLFADRFGRTKGDGSFPVEAAGNGEVVWEDGGAGRGTFAPGVHQRGGLCQSDEVGAGCAQL